MSSSFQAGQRVFSPRGTSIKRVQVRVTELSPGGDGCGFFEEKNRRYLIYLPGTVPGDVVEACISWKEKILRGKQIRILQPSKDRRTPPCPHAGSCGGCNWMHMKQGARAMGRHAVVEATVVRQLASYGLTDFSQEASIGEEYYRTRARLAVRGGDPPVVGYRGARTNTVVPVKECLVLDRRLAPIVPYLESLFQGVAGQGDAHVALGKGGIPVFFLVWNGELTSSFVQGVESALQCNKIAGASVCLSGARRPLIFGDPLILTDGPDERTLQIFPGGFAQANPTVARQLVRYVYEILRTRSVRRLLEFFSGAGTFTTLLCSLTDNYTAVEANEHAVRAARINLAERGVNHVRVCHADATEWSIPPSTDTIVLDPPRAGAKDLLSALLLAKPRTIVYVSCEASSLARDARILVEGGFSPVSLRTFDMFPQTSHMEHVLLFERRSKTRKLGTQCVIT